MIRAWFKPTPFPWLRLDQERYGTSEKRKKLRRLGYPSSYKKLQLASEGKLGGLTLRLPWHVIGQPPAKVDPGKILMQKIFTTKYWAPTHKIRARLTPPSGTIMWDRYHYFSVYSLAQIVFFFPLQTFARWSRLEFPPFYWDYENAPHSLPLPLHPVAVNQSPAGGKIPQLHSSYSWLIIDSRPRQLRGFTEMVNKITGLYTIVDLWARFGFFESHCSPKVWGWGNPWLGFGASPAPTKNFFFPVAPPGWPRFCRLWLARAYRWRIVDLARTFRFSRHRACWSCILIHTVYPH